MGIFFAFEVGEEREGNSSGGTDGRAADGFEVCCGTGTSSRVGLDLGLELRESYWDQYLRNEHFDALRILT